MKIIIYAHPENKTSHNAMVLREVISNFKNLNKEFQVIDLYEDKFNPILSNDEYNLKANPDPLVLKYQKMIKDSDEVVFIFPVWWNSAPAMLKGFFDRVITPGFAYNFKPFPTGLPMYFMDSIGKYFLEYNFIYNIVTRLIPIERHLTGINAVVINTFGGPEISYRLYHKNPSEVIDQAILEFCGMKVKRINWFNAQRFKEIPQSIKDQIATSLKKN